MKLKTLSYNTKLNIKRWLISSALSFLAGFALVLYNNIDNITINSIKDGSLAGLVFLAIRAGMKAILELSLAKNKLSASKRKK